MNRTPMRRAFARAGVLVAALALAPSAFAHAELFPNVIPSGDGYLLSLAVPNEKANASTTEVQITIPDGFDLEHVAPVQGWTVSVSGSHQESSGEQSGGSSITWKGDLKGEGLAVLPFTGVPKKPGTYAFTVRQTYSDGSVVEWSGAESSETPAARIEATADATASGGGSDSSKTIAIIALVVGALGLLVGGAGLVSGRRSA
jgi:uncharacterized protein YcnI